MEGKDRWEQKGRIFLPSPHLSLSYIYLSHHSLLHISETPALDLPPLLLVRCMRATITVTKYNKKSQKGKRERKDKINKDEK